MTHRALAFLLLLCALPPALATRDDDASQGAPPPVPTAVGPVPGPKKPAQGAINPYPQTDAVALMEGRRLFIRFNCSGCHGDHGGGGMGPSLRDVDWLYGSSDGEIFDSIAQGRAHGMPAWGTKLPADTIWRLTAYIRSLRTPREPNAPQ